MIACYCVSILLISLYWFIAHMQNRKLMGMDLNAEDVIGDFMDQTDKQQGNFRYTT